MIDYKSLLKKYIKHVSDCEGIDFIDRINEHQFSDVKFSDDESEKLKEFSNNE